MANTVDQYLLDLGEFGDKAGLPKSVVQKYSASVRNLKPGEKIQDIKEYVTQHAKDLGDTTVNGFNAAYEKAKSNIPDSVKNFVGSTVGTANDGRHTQGVNNAGAEGSKDEGNGMGWVPMAMGALAGILTAAMGGDIIIALIVGLMAFAVASASGMFGQDNMVRNALGMSNGKEKAAPAVGQQIIIEGDTPKPTREAAPENMRNGKIVVRENGQPIIHDDATGIRAAKDAEEAKNGKEATFKAHDPDGKSWAITGKAMDDGFHVSSITALLPDGRPMDTKIDVKAVLPIDMSDGSVPTNVTDPAIKEAKKQASEKLKEYKAPVEVKEGAKDKEVYVELGKASVDGKEYNVVLEGVRHTVPDSKGVSTEVVSFNKAVLKDKDGKEVDHKAVSIDAILSEDKLLRLDRTEYMAGEMKAQAQKYADLIIEETKNKVMEVKHDAADKTKVTASMGTVEVDGGKYEATLSGTADDKGKVTMTKVTLVNKADRKEVIELDAKDKDGKPLEFTEAKGKIKKPVAEHEAYVAGALTDALKAEKARIAKEKAETKFMNLEADPKDKSKVSTKFGPVEIDGKKYDAVMQGTMAADGKSVTMDTITLTEQGTTNAITVPALTKKGGAKMVYSEANGMLKDGQLKEKIKAHDAYNAGTLVELVHEKQEADKAAAEAAKKAEEAAKKAPATEPAKTTSLSPAKLQEALDGFATPTQPAPMVAMEKFEQINRENKSIPAGGDSRTLPSTKEIDLHAGRQMS